MGRPDVDDMKSAVGSARRAAAHGVAELREHLASAVDAVGDQAADLLKHGQRPADLGALPQAAKLLYCRALAAHARGDGALDPREIANIYLFATTIGLEAPARSDLRASLPGAPGPDGAAAVEALARTLPPLLEPDVRKPVMNALVRDLLRISRADQRATTDEHERVAQVAGLAYGLDATAAVAAIEKQLDADDEFLAHRITEAQWRTQSREAIANGAAVGVPIAALGMAGSVAGFSAAGITSGLAALGFGGLLGLSSMLTGIGTLVLLGVLARQGTKFVLGTGKRERERRREALVQEVLQHHQQAIADLGEDIAALVRQVEQVLATTQRDESRIARLQTELASFEQALGTLRDSQDKFVADRP